MSDRGGIRRLEKSVWMMTWKCLVYIRNGRYSWMCGGTSYMCNRIYSWFKQCITLPVGARN